VTLVERPAPPKSSPRPVFDGPAVIRRADVTRHIWGDPAAGEVFDWIYASTERVHMLVFGVPAGGGFRHSEDFRTIFAADELLHVLSGVLVIADPAEAGAYCFNLDRSQTPWTLDLRPMVRQIVSDMTDGIAASMISARFHNTIGAASGAMVRAVAAQYGAMPVVLTGGCFQNDRLAERVVGELSNDFTVHLHERVPPGDGGIALGQAVIAGAIVRRLGM